MLQGRPFTPEEAEYYRKKDRIHTWFGLTYSSYLVLPRSVLQSAPGDWQDKFVTLLEELHEMFGDVPEEGFFDVHLKDDNGRYAVDKYANYERGRRKIEVLKKLPQYNYENLL